MVHLDAPKRDGRSVVAQAIFKARRRSPPCRSARRGCDQRVHPNPATFVTHTMSMSSLKFVLWAAKT
jgi:hypothetical protein